MISFDDFAKLDLRVAKVIAAERIEGSDKLLKLALDLGEQDAADLPAGRQIVAGIGKIYEPAGLIGKEIIVVANLEPRMIKDIESQGMLLAASSPDGPVLLVPEKEVPLGSKVS